MKNTTYTRPRYQELRNYIAQDIAAGIYPVGSELPSILSLSQRYQVNHNTIEHSLKLLAAEKLIRCSPGRRARVIAAKPRENLWIAILQDSTDNYGEFDYHEGPASWLLRHELLREISRDHHTALHLSPYNTQVGDHLVPDGVIMLPNAHQMDWPNPVSIQSRPPLVVLHTGPRPPDRNAVVLDYTVCCRQVATYFLAHGVTVFLVGGCREGLLGPEGRFHEFYQALAEQNIPAERVVPVADRGNAFFTENALRQLRGILAGTSERVGGLFWSDWKARQFCDLAAECGRTVKKDVFAVGISGLPESAALMPPLSTLNIPFEKISRQMLQMLYDMIRQGTDSCPNKVFKLKFIPRGT